jgi:Rrf2 family protein
MHLSKRGEYGLRAAIFLTSAPTEEQRVTIHQIAAQENIPPKFLEQILRDLKNAGLLHSKMGASGGYYLARSPKKIMLGEIKRALDGPIAPIRCVSETAYESCGCPDEEHCGLHLVMKDVRDSISLILDNTSLADIKERMKA